MHACLLAPAIHQGSEAHDLQLEGQLPCFWRVPRSPGNEEIDARAEELLIKIMESWIFDINCHFRYLNWSYLPYIRLVCKGYVRGYALKVWICVVQIFSISGSWNFPMVIQWSYVYPIGSMYGIFANIGSILIWVNYNISLTWIKAISGWFPLLTIIPSEVAVRSL